MNLMATMRMPIKILNDEDNGDDEDDQIDDDADHDYDNDDDDDEGDDDKYCNDDGNVGNAIL